MNTVHYYICHQDRHPEQAHTALGKQGSGHRPQQPTLLAQLSDHLTELYIQGLTRPADIQLAHLLYGNSDFTVIGTESRASHLLGKWSATWPHPYFFRQTQYL